MWVLNLSLANSTKWRKIPIHFLSFHGWAKNRSQWFCILSVWNLFPSFFFFFFSSSWSYIVDFIIDSNFCGYWFSCSLIKENVQFYACKLHCFMYFPRFLVWFFLFLLWWLLVVVFVLFFYFYFILFLSLYLDIIWE